MVSLGFLGRLLLLWDIEGRHTLVRGLMVHILILHVPNVSSFLLSPKHTRLTPYENGVKNDFHASTCSLLDIELESLQ